MIIASKKQKYKCANCNIDFTLDFEDPIFCKNKVFCSKFCFIKKEFGTTEEVIRWLIKEKQN